VKDIGVLIVVGFLMYNAGKKFNYDEAYDQGKFDAQNECIVEQEVSDELKLESALEEARWQCAKQKKDILNSCSEYCGVKVI
jgi:hypothetical protein